MNWAGKIHRYADFAGNTYSFLESGANIGIKYLTGQDVTALDWLSLGIDGLAMKASPLSEEVNRDSFKNSVKNKCKSKNLKAVNKLDDVAKEHKGVMELNLQFFASRGSSERYYYHVTTQDAAERIIASGELGRRGNSWESRVFAWTEQPTKKQASIAGIGKDVKTVIRFNTNASFEPDIGNKGKSIENIVVQTTDGQRVPISIKNAEIVGFKKEWWQFWKE